MLNKEQMFAVNCENKNIVCLAGAGTGKTTVLLSRIARLCKNNIKPYEILALTFTHAAAFEMKERFEKNYPQYKCPKIETFHGFCYDLICNDENIRKELGYREIPQILDEFEENQIKLKLKVIYGLKKETKENKFDAKQQLKIRQYENALKHELISANKITFDTLSKWVTELFINNNGSADRYKNRYKHILVDEFQDTDNLQWEFVSSFINSNIFVCGDALQNLYRFRGTTNEIIKKLSKSENWTNIKLYENYRSNKTICNFANEMSVYADNSYRIEISPAAEKEQSATEQSAEQESEQKSESALSVYDISQLKYNIVADEVIDDIVKNLQNCIGTTAILARSNRESEELVKVLTERGIKLNSSLLYKDIPHIIESVFDDNYLFNYLESLANSDTRIKLLNIKSQKDKEITFADLISLGNIHINEYWTKIQNIRSIIQNTIQKSDEICYNDTCNSYNDSIKGICKILDIVPADTEDPADSITTQEEFFNEIKKLPERKNNTDIYAGTIHSVKGLEFNNVFLINVNGKYFKLDNEDNLNLYYVGITRAKDRLFVYKKG